MDTNFLLFAHCFMYCRDVHTAFRMQGVTFWIRIMVEKNSVADPGSGAFLSPGSGMGKSLDPDPGSGMNIPDPIRIRELRNSFHG